MFDLRKKNLQKFNKNRDFLKILEQFQKKKIKLLGFQKKYFPIFLIKV